MTDIIDATHVNPNLLNCQQLYEMYLDLVCSLPLDLVCCPNVLIGILDLLI